MIVTNSAIAMAASHTQTQVSVVEERVFWQEASSPAPALDSGLSESSRQAPKLIDLSEAGSVLARHRMRQTLDLSQEVDSKDALNLKILQATLKGIFGKALGLCVPVAAEGKPAAIETSLPSPITPQTISGQSLVYERTQMYRETESLSFAAKGIVNTADGRSISFDISLNMSREFTQITSSTANIFSGGQVQLIDPIVINFDGKGAELVPDKIQFDLDMDGTADQISRLGSGSGYLAWDKNNDGKVNDGSELFGPTTGRGFAELAQHDSDGNGFIDEADPIYSQLRIWIQNPDGTTQLFALGEKDVGAIFLGHASTPFSINNSTNQVMGQLANSSVYLKDSGGVGLVQEIYLAT
ncbi:MAG: hypothetical protein ACI4NJ_03805 [Cellvibrio sp.]